MPRILVPSFSLFFARFSLSPSPPPAICRPPPPSPASTLRHRTRIESKTIEGGEGNVRKIRFSLSVSLTYILLTVLFSLSLVVSLSLPLSLSLSLSLSFFPYRRFAGEGIALSPATRDPRRTNTGFLSAQKGAKEAEGERRRVLANDSAPLYLDTFIANVLYPAVKVLTAGNS